MLYTDQINIQQQPPHINLNPPTLELTAVLSRLPYKISTQLQVYIRGNQAFALWVETVYSHYQALSISPMAVDIFVLYTHDLSLSGYRISSQLSSWGVWNTDSAQSVLTKHQDYVAYVKGLIQTQDPGLLKQIKGARHAQCKPHHL